ncbi:MAG: acyl carrier protein [Arenicella sp.]|jgi:acyl carrier protein
MELFMEDFKQIESTIRTALIEDLAMQQAEFLELDDPLEMDSLAQTEMRIFIETKYSIPIDLDQMPPQATESLNTLVTHIQAAIKQ